ncbi:hypothetical protein lerEdw1_004934 [Lerista edwardsae]|nr:hypothetical protein lerEdw1_004934 [Lerista edwardsae]
MGTARGRCHAVIGYVSEGQGGIRTRARKNFACADLAPLSIVAFIGRPSSVLRWRRQLRMDSHRKERILQVSCPKPLRLHLDVPDVQSEETSDSDSDSGQGSSEMSSPAQMSKGVASVDDGDSDEEICVSKRSRSKKVLSESESEEEAFAPDGSEAAAEDVEKAKEGNADLAVKKKKSFRNCQGRLDSDGTDDEDKLENSVTSANPGKKLKSHNVICVEQIGRKERGSSRRRKMEKEKRKKAIKQMKKEKKQEEKENPEAFPFDDSGCLLADKDLFENGLEDEEEADLPQDGESLESIKAAAREKMKKQAWIYTALLRNKQSAASKLHSESEGHEEPFLKEPRKERRAAKLSKEAIKQLHSETQRLVREASMPLPYHVPETKSIHQFFKRKPRPAFQGSAMTLLKSAKYQPLLNGESAVLKEPGANSSESRRTERDQPAMEDLETGTHLQESVLNAPVARIGGSSAGEVEEVAASCLMPNKQGRDSTPESSAGTSASGLPEKPHLILAECSELVTDRGNTNVLEQIKEQSVESSAGPQEPVPPPAIPEPGEKAKKSKLDRLREMGVDLTVKPRLCSGDSSFINLEEPQPNHELEALKERFVKHSCRMTKPKTERMVNLNIIRKETSKEGKEELKADVVLVKLGPEAVEEATHTKPGEKLQVLKAKLQEAMKLRRTEERKKRQALFKLDNEDMLEEEEEEEEEEMTDMSDEEEEEEQESYLETVEYLLGEAEEDHEELEEQGLGDGDKETDKDSADEEPMAKAVHCPAFPKPSSSESTLLLFKDNSSKTGYSLPGEKAEMEESGSKRSGKPEDEDSFLLPSVAKENSHNSSFELIGSMIPSYQPCNKQLARGGNFLSAAGGVRSPSPGFFKTSFISSASKSSGKASEPSLPIEDSQDLYNATPEEKSPVPATGRLHFQFSLEDDTQSQLLDADGFLNVGPHRNKYQSSKSHLPLASMDENAMDANMGELLGLCSGQFASQDKHPPGTDPGKKRIVEELLGLCSGKFASQDSPTRASSANSKLEQESSLDDAMAEAAALCSGSFPSDSEEDEQKSKGKEEEEDDEDEDSNDEMEEEEEEEEDEVEVDDEEEVLRQRERPKKKLKLQDFMEDEAELSGSEVGSEDEYDGEELDVYEEDVIEEALPTDDELQDQVNKIHRKVMLDDDKRQLRLYQERYLADGDLHSDGPGRVRRFRWKNIDDASQTDLFHQDADNDEENEEHLDEAEARWRKERFEREQWLREQSDKGKEEEEEEIDENSQFMKLAKKVTVKSLQKKATVAVAIQETKTVSRNPFEAFWPANNPQLKNGSLLNRPKAVLQKLAAMSDLNPNAPRNSRNFVFQTLSPVKSEEAREKSKPQAKKRALASTAAPSPKRLRLNGDEAQETRSIFQFLER